MASSKETGTIQTTVPTEHSITIEAEHASALYLEGTRGESDAYVVPRFSEPSFQLSVEKGWTLERVLLNDQDVTNQITQGILKYLPPYQTGWTSAAPGESNSLSAGRAETVRSERSGAWNLFAAGV